MTDPTFRILFEGRIRDGEDQDEVTLRLARLFKKDKAKIAALFGGGPVVIRKGLDHATAHKYKKAIDRAGGLCRVEPAAAVQKQTPAVAQARTKPAGNQAAVVCPNCGYHFISSGSAHSPALSIKFGRPVGSLWKHT
jgi:hypothetical protein